MIPGNDNGAPPLYLRGRVELRGPYRRPSLLLTAIFAAGGGVALGAVAFGVFRALGVL